MHGGTIRMESIDSKNIFLVKDKQCMIRVDTGSTRNSYGPGAD